MSLSIAIAQVQLRPQYHPSYSDEPKSEAGRPISKLRQARKEKLHAISLKIGRAIHAEILAVIRQSDPKIHKDDCRKMLDELCSERRMDKLVTYGSGKRVFYTARPA
jgi:hypothetical protein